MSSYGLSENTLKTLSRVPGMLVDPKAQYQVVVALTKAFSIDTLIRASMNALADQGMLAGQLFAEQISSTLSYSMRGVARYVGETIGAAHSVKVDVEYFDDQCIINDYDSVYFLAGVLKNNIMINVLKPDAGMLVKSVYSLLGGVNSFVYEKIDDCHRDQTAGQTALYVIGVEAADGALKILVMGGTMQQALSASMLTVPFVEHAWGNVAQPALIRNVYPVIVGDENGTSTLDALAYATDGSNVAENMAEYLQNQEDSNVEKDNDIDSTNDDVALSGDMSYSYVGHEEL